ncbi:hypothetical protein [Ancylobacter defluvii]|uniref:hypothetical protein n=1 Tax=Ancylobacter defluvii TaxID=1282440 RepID=UPI001BCCBF5C|nr:hypothetical protein [Ancylobacter defluvii]MBS7588324.1 hypothetical protein [Ancylobacter defluvii]
MVAETSAGQNPEQLASAARHIERDMHGEPVLALAWEIYFGKTTGAVDWRSMERMARCVEAARVLLQMQPLPE